MTDIDRILALFCNDKKLMAIYSEINQVKDWALQNSELILHEPAMMRRLITVLYFPHFRMNVWTDTSISTDENALHIKGASAMAMERARVHRKYSGRDIRSGRDYVELFQPRILQKMKSDDFVDFIRNG